MRILTRIDGSISGATLSFRLLPGLSSTPSPYGSIIRHEDKDDLGHGLLVPINRCCTLAPQKRHGASYSFIQRRYYNTTVVTCRRFMSSYFCSNMYPSRKWNHTAASTAEPIEPAEPTEPAEPVSSSQERRSKHELLDLVDQYDDTPVEEHLTFLKDPYLRRYAPADGPNLEVSDREEDENLQSVDPRQRLDPELSETVRRLREAVSIKLRRPPKMELDEIYELYLLLPEPRMTYISAFLRHQLLAVLGMTERKDPKSMLRYFAVVTDVKNSGFPLTLIEWNTALSFASRYVGRSTEVELEAALHLWREMEHVAGIRASEVTFNILFDVASKARKLDLAEMIYQEMITRGFSFNRYHHVSLIHFFGLRQDTSGLRAAYREMVNAGEVIDSTVLNCVISGLLLSGEEDSALRVYQKMTNSNRELEHIPDRDYTMQKNITKVLMMFARIGKTHPDMRPNFQKTALISPDLQTYRLLINHFGCRLGSLPRVVQFLDEMKMFNVPVHGAIFLAMFKGFGKHGGPGSDWSSERLFSVWNAFLSALDADSEGLHINTWMAMAILTAFSRFSSKDHILDIYETLRSKWDLDATNSQFMIDFLKRLTQQGGYRPRHMGVIL
ncbi:uncharacterized protein GGS25DRAFT_481923 [Hypoxylon fragiforme]|uniref:uncharacterized protein n=1 Tax=Hypoxylon fragiforme TaxID=63214 RepID=UPI0020C63366|nr:uncharacterized protein GGS25DRAFT_481923 [Hypoxylon fragiforme]KAI2611235.1 hypothetical protein GGS25DRAFT_481923 [Hypoxylon fragiforme]